MTRTSAERGSGLGQATVLGGAYARIDQHMDYQEFEVNGLRCRGPRPATLEPGRYIACIGAAQTYGRHCARPYPLLLSKALGEPVINLGIAGAGPRKVLELDRVMALVNNARFVVLQVLSGRSASNSRIVSPSGGGRVSLDGESLERAMRVWRRAMGSIPEREVRALMAETRRDWLASLEALVAAIERPIVLLWFSRRTPRYTDDFSKVQKLTGGFPHFVNEEMVATLRPAVAEYVECVTRRGWPFVVRGMDGKPLQTWRRSLGDILRHQSLRAPVRNRYYPSPEMHEDAAAALAPVCRRLLTAHGGTT